MSLLFFYDTETTGLPDFKEPSDAPHQPHIVQAAALVVDAETRLIVNSANLIVRPDGWEIPADADTVHGITTEYAMDVGVDESLVTEVMLDLWRTCNRRIGHNQSFDARILRIALKRFATEAVADEWKAGAAECTCYQARPHTALPKNKLPKLTEAYEHFFGKPLENAHSALADAQACADVYWAIRDREAAAA